MAVEKFINLTRFVKNYEEIMGDAMATHMVNTASRLVRVDKATLKNSIRKEKTSNGYIVETGALPYAAAQEWGLKEYGKPNYKWTSYMRPAAMEMKNAQIIRVLSDKAIKAAVLRSIR